MNARRGTPLTLADGVVRHISASCGGDVRKAMNSVELLFSAAGEGGVITLEDAKGHHPARAMRYDRDRGRPLRHPLRADEVAARLRSGRGDALSGAAARSAI